jgi:hypothetical protein
MPEHRRYTKRQKLATVMAAEMSGLTATADTTGIPKTTIKYWMPRRSAPWPTSHGSG